MKKKDEKIANLESHVKKLTEKLDKVDYILDKHEQYSRRNCLLIHGIPEEKDESTDEKVMNVLNNDMNINDITKDDIDRSHRIGKKKGNGKPRAVIVKFCGYNKRNKVFKNKKVLKGKSYSITEF